MTDRATASIAVWDLPTRLFHWTLLLLVCTSVITAELDTLLGPGTLEWHERSGVAILGLLLFRLGWGFVGGSHARFSSFLRGPWHVIAYAKGLLGRGEAKESVGHNPLGGWSVVAMLAALAVQAGTGLFLVQEDFAFEAPLARHVSRAVSDRLGAIHEANVWVIGALVALHVSAIVYYAVAKRQDLVGAMLSGRKRVAVELRSQASRGGGLPAGIAIALASAAALWALLALA
jgi:cytochrome b